MRPIDRRKFLHLVSMGMGALAFQQFLAACGIKPASDEPAPLPYPGTNTPPSSTSTNTDPPPTNTNTPVKLPDLVVAHGNDPESLVRQSIQAMGGMDRFVKPGFDVIIKPNICVGYHSYEYAATTNPWVVGALVKLCQEAGAGRVRVMDNPFGGPAEECYRVSGIAEQVTNAGGEMEIMQALKFVKTDVPGGVNLKNIPVYDDILKADLVIDVPIAKHHSSAGLTLGMKNLMGTVLNREKLHTDLANSIVDLAFLIKPTLTIIDAIRILTANGPTGGNLNDVQQLNTIVVSTDIAAADSYAATLFGKTASDISHIRIAGERGLGNVNLEQLNILKLNVPS